jgi:hypothetical protein
MLPFPWDLQAQLGSPFHPPTIIYTSWQLLRCSACTYSFTTSFPSPSSINFMLARAIVPQQPQLPALHLVHYKHPVNVCYVCWLTDTKVFLENLIRQWWGSVCALNSFHLRPVSKHLFASPFIGFRCLSCFVPHAFSTLTPMVILW